MYVCMYVCMYIKFMEAHIIHEITHFFAYHAGSKH